MGRRTVVGLFLSVFALCLFAGCCTAPVVTDDIGKPLTDATITGTEISGTAENIAVLVAELPASPTQSALKTESEKLSSQVAALNSELKLARAGYYSTLEDVGALEADRDEWKEKAMNRLVVITALSGASALLSLILGFGIYAKLKGFP